MKKIVLLFLGISLIACGASKTVRDSKKVIKGNWALTSIDYSESGEFKVNLLNDVSKECFEGSNWEFVPNNNTGTYRITKADCSVGSRYFVFTILEVDSNSGLYDFLLKPTDQKHKSDTNQGFRLKLTNITETAMQWQQTVTVDDSPFTITMNFTKL